MIIHYNDIEKNSVVIHYSYDNTIVKEFLKYWGLNAVGSDSIQHNEIIFSRSANKHQAHWLADALEKNLRFAQSMCILKKSKDKVKSPVRHYTVDIGKNCAAKNDLLNNQIVFILLPEDIEIYQCTVHIVNDTMEDDEIRVPPMMNNGDCKDVLLFRPHPHFISRVLTQKANRIKGDIITISKSLYDEFAKLSPSSLEIRHLATGATITQPFNLVESENGLANNQIRLTFYHREILNISTKDKSHKPSTYYSALRDKVLRTSEDCDMYFQPNDSESYKTTESYNRLQIVPVKELRKKRSSILTKMCDWVVGPADMRISAVRPYKIDDSRDIVRLSEDSMAILGIEDTDQIILEYKNRSCKARVMQIDSYELMKETNIIDSENDLDLMAGIPAPLRRELGIGDLETEITIRRDTFFLFAKNLNIQMLSVLGLVLAVFQIGDKYFIQKSVICAALLPLIIYFSLSQERSRVKNIKRKL